MTFIELESARKPRILVVEDDQDENDEICGALNRTSAFLCESTLNKKSFDAKLATQSHDVISIDWNVDELDIGGDLVEQARKLNPLASVLVCSQFNKREDAFASGADFYVAKHTADYLSSYVDVVKLGARLSRFRRTVDIMKTMSQSSLPKSVQQASYLTHDLLDEFEPKVNDVLNRMLSRIALPSTVEEYSEREQVCAFVEGEYPGEAYDEDQYIELSWKDKNAFFVKLLGKAINSSVSNLIADSNRRERSQYQLFMLFSRLFDLSGFHPCTFKRIWFEDGMMEKFVGMANPDSVSINDLFNIGDGAIEMINKRWEQKEQANEV